MNGLLTICKKQDGTSTDLVKLIDTGLQSLSHRGTDMRSTFTFNNRLQPSTAEAATVAAGVCSRPNGACFVSIQNNTLLFDGHLLNAAELCRQLDLLPENRSDAEIAFQWIKRHKGNGHSDDISSAFRSLKGFWALIYLDAESQTIYGARDHFGNRPLSFCNTNNQFAVATESRTLYSLFDDARRINRHTVADFLLWGDIGKLDQYFFTDIQSLEPSHYFKYDMEYGHLTVEKYYTLPYNRSAEHFDRSKESQYIDKLRDMIASSVHANLQLFDGAVAIGVSGGMDSSTLMGLAKQIMPQKTMVAYTTTDEYDGGEVRWAEKIVKHVGAEWVKVTCTAENIAAQLYDINRAHSVPVYNASSAVQYFIMEKIKTQGQAVFFDGQGGDEMLGGYPAYFPLLLQSLRRNWLLCDWWNELSKVANTGMTVQDIFMRRLKLWAKALYYNPQRMASQEKHRKIYYDGVNIAVRDACWTVSSPLPTIKKTLLNDALFESYTIFLGNILRWGEHSAASQSIDCVMPFSDYPDLTEYAFSIPSSYKIHDGWNKYLLRKAMVGIIPDEICWRREKKGFYIPEQNWLENNVFVNEMFRVINTMDDPACCINLIYVRENLNKYYCRQNPLFQRFIFRCYSYLLWINGL